MNGSNAKIVPEINLDEFERRLRSAGAPQEGVEDPLIELTRLVDMISRDNDNVQNPEAPAAPPVALPPTDHFDRLPPPPPPLPRAPQMEFEPPTYGEPDLEPLVLSHEERAGLLVAAAEARAPLGHGRAWYFKTAGLAVVGIALFGGAAALKFGIQRGAHGMPPFIAAAAGPNKIKPPSDATVQSSNDAGALLTKDSTTPGPVKMVATEEEPVDLRAQTPAPSPSPSPMPVASASPTPAAPRPPASSAPPAVAPAPSAPAPNVAALTANAASPVAPASDTPIVVPGEATATVAPLFPDAKPVKTVSVRPDGTLISTGSEAAPTPAPSPPAKTATRVADNSDAAIGVASEPATPKLDLPTKLSPKSTARVVAKTDTTAPAGATDTTPNAPLRIGATPELSRAEKRAAAREKVAEATANDPAAASDPAKHGEWAVQLAAPRSEADAKKDIARLKRKFADALGGAELGVHKADVRGETIYRVRSDGLSKAEAGSMCAKLKASGGDCFVARN